MRSALVPVIAVLALAVGCAPAAQEPAASSSADTGPTATASLPVTEELGARIEAIIADADNYQVGVAISDDTGTDVHVFGDESPFFAASTAKVLCAAAYYHLVETGERSLDDPLGGYEAAYHLEAMINVSDNNSWLLLMQSIGFPELIAYAESIGVVYDPQKNLLTTADMAETLQQLRSGELLNEDNTQQLLGYMQETNNELLIPAGVQPDIEVHHKYGQIDGNLHDAALLTYRDSTEALVIYTNRAGAGSEAEQIELIRTLAGEAADALIESVPR